MKRGGTGWPGRRTALYGLPVTVAAAMLGIVLVANPAEYGAGGVAAGLAFAGLGLVSSLRLFRIAGRPGEAAQADGREAGPSPGLDDHELPHGSGEPAALKQGDAGI